ncbi:hypothetical protein AOLI_G00231500 [Acnodon oligacanthus]
MSGHAVYSVSEEVSPGTVVGNLAKDLNLNLADLEPRRLRLVSGSSKKRFEVDLKTGALFVLDSIDREELCPNSLTCTETLEAIVNDPLQMHSVEVKILDINDHPPVFPGKSQTIRVAELALIGSKFPLLGAEDPDMGGNTISSVREDARKGTVIALITVQDKDGGKNGKVHCSISKNSPFVLESTQGKYYSLVLNGALDREEKELYNVSIVATDEGSPPLSSTAVVTVRVSDVNDNPPRFPEPLINVYVKENSPAGGLIALVSAPDIDVGENAHVTYSLLDSSNMPLASAVNINSMTGEIYSMQSFNFEEVKHFQFKVQATDSGAPPLSSNVTVNVFILDENDNSPVILPPYSEAGSVNTENVPYSAEGGYFVAKIRAVDADSGYNALLSYHITEPKGTNLFRIGSSSGEIRTKRRMSDHDLKTHPLVVTVCDHGEPSLSATVTVEVVVVESLDMGQPSLRQVPMKEEGFSDLNLYLLIAIVSVSVIFLLSLIGLIAAKCCGSEGGLSRCSGPVVTTHPDGSWSYSKATQQYDVCFSSDTLKSDVVVFPSPFPPADAELISINGGDTFTRTQTLPSSGKIVYSVSEEVKEGTVVGNVAKDLNINVQDLEARMFQIVSNKKYFGVNLKTGALFVTERIDREALCPKAQRCSMHIEAMAQNPLRLFRIEVNIMDINDNAPLFTVSNQMLNITELSALGEKFTLPLAEDPDTGSNAVKSYKLSPNEHFSLDVQNGEDSASVELVLKKALDRETQPVIHLILTALDGGKPPLSGTLEIVVNVLDVNDNSPVFSQSLYKVKVNENVPFGAQVLSLSATDLDEGVNGEIVFATVRQGSAKGSDLFSVDPESGVITVKGEIDYEENAAVELRVEAKDKGQPPKSSQCKVLVEIIDVNDNPPEIEVTSLTNTVKEDCKEGTAVALFTVSDKDGGRNGVVHCNILGHVPFKIESSYRNYYSLVVDGPLDREKVAVYNITIQATDEGGYFVAKIRAVDADSGYNALLSYHITEPKGTNLFRIGSSSGEIRTKRRMSDHDLKTHPLVVTVCDHGEPSLSATVTVEVVVVESLDMGQPSLRQVPMKEEGFSDLNLYLLIAIVSVSVIFLLSLIGLMAAKCCGSEGGLSRCSGPVVTTHPDGSWSYSKATQQYDVCFSSDTLKSDVVVFPSPFPPADAELISINGGDTFTRTQTLPSSGKVRGVFLVPFVCVYTCLFQR